MYDKGRLVGAAVAFLAGDILGYFGGQEFPLGRIESRLTPEHEKTATRLGTWELQFKGQASIRLPEGQPIVKFDFGRPSALDLPVTITNLADYSYKLSYVVFGYDSKGRRVSEYRDETTFGGHESVVREMLSNPIGYGSLNPAVSTLRILATAER